MFNNTVCQIVFLDTGAGSHKGGSYGSIASAVDSGETICVVAVVAFCNIVDNIAGFWTAFA